jgi:hypothetical protein
VSFDLRSFSVGVANDTCSIFCKDFLGVIPSETFANDTQQFLGDLYIALIYGILYLCFVAYPIIFTDIRGW